MNDCASFRTDWNAAGSAYNVYTVITGLGVDFVDGLSLIHGVNRAGGAAGITGSTAVGDLK